MKIPCINKTIPIGTNATPTNFTNISRSWIISECSTFFIFLASNVNLEIYESLPTAVSLALHFPAIIKLPDINLSPGFLGISSDSPVNKDSFTKTSPLTISLSAKI